MQTRAATSNLSSNRVLSRRHAPVQSGGTCHGRGGRYLVRGNVVQALEGSWDHDRMVVEFPDRDAALAWYHSAQHRPLRELRQQSAEAVIPPAEGVPDEVLE